ncbi:MAG TPA: DeoR/GlpR family DNA-binding transcription regulator [Magnetospirillaceae bacterium]|jgi:DeoR family ulaG and ulaABCDEF operon transcriptional repressor
MLERERHQLIQKLVDERSIIGVGDLVELLGASEATVRRDINAMAERGEIKRVRGGAEALQARHRAHLAGVPFEMSRDICVPQKRAIARAAAGMIQPGESIIINGGTTTWRLVEFLRHADLDILTNSFPIAAELLATGNSRITLPGGTIYREQNTVISPYQSDVVSHFWASTMFTGCFGINTFGLMETDPQYVQCGIRLLERAERLVVMADSRKLRQRSSMIVAGIDRVTTLITDSGAQPEELETLRRAGVDVTVADVTEADQLAAVA